MVEEGYFVLNTGAHIPVIGLGTWKSKPDVVETAVKYAISEGYRHIDCAYLYLNEDEVGRGISAKIKDGTIKRDDIFVTSKLSFYKNEPEKVESCCKESLQKLGLDYLDLYLIHWPVALKHDKTLEEAGADVSYINTWKAMEQLVGKGYVKCIGVSNFNRAQLEEISVKCSIKPAVNQVEVHPYLNNIKLTEYCKSKGIVVVAYSPFASPDQGRKTWKEDDPKPLQDAVILEIASKYKVLPAQVILKWLTQRGIVALPKSVTPERIRSNIRISHFSLTAEEMERIIGLNIPFRVCDLKISANSKDYPFNEENE